MADANDPRVAKELAEAMKAVGEYAEEATDAFERQAKVVMQMRDAMEEVAKVMYALCQQDCKALNPEVWKTVTKEVLKTNQAMKNTTKATKDLSKAFEKDLKTALLVTVGALEGLVKGFKNLMAIGKSFAGMVGSIVGTVYEVGKAILAIPFKIMEGLFSMAGKGGSNELDTALQGVVKKYGDLEGASSRAIVNAAKSMKTINEGGIDMYRVFGNLAERIKYVQEMAQGLGSTFEIFKQEVNDNGVAMAVYQKGLGVTHEQMEGIAFTALRMGTGITDVMNDMTKSSQALSKAFGVTAKVISADMAKAMKDLAHFGHLAKDEFAATAAFANKLGVSVDKLTSIMDATKTYDQTAESMSKLNETFNTNIDYSKMMMLAQKGPAAQIQYLREEFRKAGKDLSNLDYFEKNLIKSTGVMSDEMLAAAFATKNANVSYDAMLKVSQKATKETLSQGDALKTLKKEIEKRPMEGQLGEGGIFDRFLQGMEMGMERSPAFMKLLMNIRQIFRDAYWAGFKFGQMIVDVFPGVKDILGGLADVFDPSKFKKLFADITSVFKDFASQGGKNVDGLLKNLQEKFLNFFDKESPAGKKVIEGFSKFWDVIGGILGKLSEIVVNKLTDAVNFITDWINNGMKIPKTASDTFLGKFIAPFQGAIDALADKLFPALERLASTLWDKLMKALFETDIGNKILLGGFVVLFGPAILGALTGAIAAGAMKGVGKLILGGIAESITKEKAGAADIAKSIAESAQAAPKTAGASEAVNAVGQVIPDKKSIEGLTTAQQLDFNWAKIKQFVAGLAMVMGVLFVTFGAVALLASQLEPATVMKAIPIFGAITLSLAPVALFLSAISQIKEFNEDAVNKSLKMMAKILAIGVVAFAGAALLVAVLNPPLDAIAKTAAISIAMAATFAPMGILAIEAAAVGKILNALGGTAVSGFLAMTGIMFGMATAVGALTFLIKALGGEGGMDAMKSVADIMSTISSVFMKVGVVIGEAALIGLAIVKSAGIGGGLIIVGFAAMTGAVTVMTATAMSMIKDITAIPNTSSELKGKVEIFVDVLNSLTGLMNVIPGILKGLDFGFWDSAKEKTDRIDAVGEMIHKLLSGKDGKGGIKGIVDSIIGGFTGSLADMTPDKVRSFGVVSDIIKSITGLVSGIASATKSADIGEIKVESGGVVSIVNQIPDITTIIQGISATVPGLIDNMKKVIMAVPTDKDFLDRMSKFTQIIDTIGKVVGFVTSAMSGLRKKGYKETDYSPTKVIGENLKFVNDVFVTLAEGAPANSAAGVSKAGNASLSEILYNMNRLSVDKTSLEKATSIAGFLEQTSKITESILKAGAGANLDNPDQEISRISKSMYIAHWLLEHLLKGTDKNGTIGTAPGGDGSLGAIGKSLLDISNNVSSVDPNSALGGVSKKINDLLTKVGEITSKIVSSPVASAQNVGESLLGIKATIDSIPDKMKLINASLESLSKEPVTLSTAGLVANMGALTRVIAAVNAFNSEMGKIPTLGLPAKLEATAKGLGFGGEYVYNVKSNAVQIHLHLDVTMDADKVEKAIVHRETSVIRDRINYIMETAPIKAAVSDSAYVTLHPTTNKSKESHI
jgi:hypothetical protein